MSKTRRSVAVGLAGLIVMAAWVAGAALLGNLIDFPRVVFAGGNTNIVSGTLSVNSAPIILQTSAVAAPIFINPDPGSGFEAMDISVQVAASCELIGGVAGDDLFLQGEVDLGGGDVRSGTLLTGEVVEFGFLDAGVTELFDFRFTVTGGLIADLYTNDDLGVLVQSENSTFTANCGNDSTGEAKGTLGSIPPILPAEGCTPGYWKQKHHFDSWVNYSPDDLFADVFGRTVDGVTDLKSALKAKGGGVKALTRHSVAALLNVASGDVNVQSYATEADVIAAFQAAFDSGDYEPQKDLFEELNEEGCPLN